MGFDEAELLVVGPALLVDPGVKIVVPPFAALLAITGGSSYLFVQNLSYLGPFFETKLLHQAHNELVLFLAP